MYWWLKFLTQWNGSCCIHQTLCSSSPAVDLYTDASSVYSYWCGRWIQAKWPVEHINNDITWMELYGIAEAVNTWGTSGYAKVPFHCDNQSVCEMAKGVNQAA